MPPSNFLAMAEQNDDGNSSDEQKSLLNSHTKNILNTKNKNKINNGTDKMTKEKVDINGNIIENHQDKRDSQPEYQMEIVWRNVIVFLVLHMLFVYGVLMYWRLNFVTLFNYLFGVFTGFGITAGAHRLWAHGAYKAKLPLRIFLAFFQTAATQNTIFEWVRDHRAHHKFTDTNADPHNATRGFFFSHMGWLMCRKHPDVKIYGRKVDMSDLERDSVVVFQRSHYLPLVLLCHFVIPISLSMMIPGVAFKQAFYLNIYRYVIALHCTWLVNSYAHFFGNKPFDRFIKPSDSYTAGIMSFGEGWHNYHHVFPYDYKTSEHGKYWCNMTTGLIDFMAKLGLATDLKFVDPKTVYKRALRTGDGSLVPRNEVVVKKVESKVMDEHVWGWHDAKMSNDDKSIVRVLNRTESIKN